MSALVDKQKPQPQKAFRPATALAKIVKFKDELMEVHLTDGRILSVPVIWFSLLMKPPQNKEKNMKLVEEVQVYIGKKSTRIYP